MALLPGWRELPTNPWINLTVLVTAVTLHMSTELAHLPISSGDPFTAVSQGQAVTGKDQIYRDMFVNEDGMHEE